MLVLQDGRKNPPKSRVELHIHLDGAVRLETVWDLSRQKQLPLPGDGSLPALQMALRVSQPSDLANFLSSFSIIGPAIQGDLAAIERISREFVEDRSRDHVAYCEARFSPQLLLAAPPATQPHLSAGDAPVNGCAADTEPPVVVTLDDVMEAVLKGIAEGENNCPGTKVRLLLCCIRNMPQWSWEVLRLCERYRERGVLGIDIAGNYNKGSKDLSYSEGSDVFQAAAAAGIRRTVHAGEDAPAESVKAAIDDLKAERIGHGYRVLEDDLIYQHCKDINMHFEVCPHSSYLTGAIGDLKLASKQHPVIRFAADGVRYSVSTDDPTITHTRLEDEYTLLREWGFTEADAARANFNAALDSFLPAPEKQLLLQQLREAYGVVDLPLPSPHKQTRSSPERPNITFNTWENRS